MRCNLCCKEIDYNANIDALIEYAINIIRAFSTLVDTDGIYYVNEKGGINFKPWKK